MIAGWSRAGGKVHSIGRLLGHGGEPHGLVVSERRERVRKTVKAVHWGPLEESRRWGLDVYGPSVKLDGRQRIPQGLIGGISIDAMLGIGGKGRGTP